MVLYMNNLKCLTNNQLKIIACISMFFDHLGVMCFPKILVFRIIGRIAFPIFAFMIAEGCYYTKNKLKHLLTIFILGVIMQIVLYFAMNMTDFSIFLVFTVSIILIYLFEYLDNNIKEKNILMTIITSVLFLSLTIGLIWYTNNYTYFVMNYNFYGIIIPVNIYIIKKYFKKYHIILSAITIIIGSILHAIHLKFYVNILAIFGVMLLFLYNGKRGKSNLKYFFYLFYPLHFVLIYGIQLLLSGNLF